MTTWTVVVYCRAKGVTACGPKCGALWWSSGRGRRWLPDKTATMAPSSGRPSEPSRGAWRQQHSLTWRLISWSGSRSQWKCRMTQLSTTSWDMHWVGAWGYSMRMIVSLGLWIHIGFRAPPTSLLACSAGLSWWPMSPSQKLWRVSRGKSVWEFWRRHLAGELRGKALPTRNGYVVVCCAWTVGRSWR